MAWQLKQLKQIAKMYHAPVICAGDIFDHWNSCPELINFAIQHLPKGMYAIPGQHDLPNHSLKDIQRTAYWSLVEAGIIKHISPDFGLPINPKLCLWGFPWGCEIKPLGPSNGERVHLAVCHAYIWKGEHCYRGAPKEQQIQSYRDRLQGYTAAVFGDNHKGWISKNGKILNCGGFQRRKIDEKDYRPHVGLLLKDGTICRIPLNVEDDKFIELEETLIATQIEIGDFLSELMQLADNGLNFHDAVMRMLESKSLSRPVADLLRESIEKR